MHFTEGSTKCMKHLLNEFSKSVDKEINKKSRYVQQNTDKHLYDLYQSISNSHEIVKKIIKSPKRFTSKLNKNV